MLVLCGFVLGRKDIVPLYLAYNRKAVYGVLCVGGDYSRVDYLLIPCFGGSFVVLCFFRFFAVLNGFVGLCVFAVLIFFVSHIIKTFQNKKIFYDNSGALRKIFRIPRYL